METREALRERERERVGGIGKTDFGGNGGRGGEFKWVLSSVRVSVLPKTGRSAGRFWKEIRS